MGEEMKEQLQFGKQLKKLMTQKGWTQQQLATLLGVSQPAISQYLKGRIPQSDVLLRLSLISGKSMEYLLTGKTSGREVPRVAEGKEGYGDEGRLLELWRQLPEPVRSALLQFLQKVVEGMH